MAQLYSITYRTAGGQKETRISPHVASGNHALVWILKIKPYLIRQLTEMEVRPWTKDTPK